MSNNTKTPRTDALVQRIWDVEPGNFQQLVSEMLTDYKTMETELNTARAEVDRLKRDSERLRKPLERIARATGIVEPLQLIAMAENDEENHADILARHVEQFASAMAEGGAGERPHWWCPHCKEEVPPTHVTYSELHESCGYGVRWIEDGEGW